MIRRRVLALGALLGLCATVPVAEPAQACSCSSRDLDVELARGSAVAIVTRVDSRAGTAARFRVERSYGADLPATLSGQVDAGMDCHPQVFPQDVTALVYRRDGGWVLPELLRTRPR